MRLSNHVEGKDVDEAIALVKYATQQAATDPNTGLIDMDVIVTGKTSASRQKVNKVKMIIDDLIRFNVGKYKKATTFDSVMIDVDKKMDLG
jgi:DNA replicative helicase MCM subunit Mcm2 (Cdc46/Mcm family)